MLFNAFVKLFAPFMVAAAGSLSWGKFELFGLERYMSRDAANVAVAYEISSTYRSQFHMRAATTNVINAVI
jgi:hypothetical protein